MTKLPKTIAFELSSVCPLKCTYCDMRNWKEYNVERNRKFMNIELFKKVIIEMVQTNYFPSVVLSYEGESLLHPHFVDILKYLNKYKMRPWITTSLLDCNDEKMEAMIKYCDTISVSLDGNEELFIKNRGNLKQFKIVNENLTKLLELSKESIVNINLNLTMCPPYTLSSHLVVDFISNWIDKVDTLYIWKQISFRKKISYSYRKGIEDHLKRRRPCHQPFNYAAILSDGSIAPCCNTSRTLLRGLNVDDGLLKVFKSEMYINYLHNHAKGFVKGTCCEMCELWLDDWLGDEIVELSDNNRGYIKCYCEGNTVRIPSDGVL